MGGFHVWINENWFSVAQTIGVVGGLFFTGATIRQEARARETKNLLAFAERHRSLWGDIAQRPELHRIIARCVDLSATPITTAEEIALNLVLVHFELGWRMARNADRSDLKPLAKDIRNFFALPLPHAIWIATKNCHNQRFVCFVEKAMKSIC